MSLPEGKTNNYVGGGRRPSYPLLGGLATAKNGYKSKSKLHCNMLIVSNFVCTSGPLEQNTSPDLISPNFEISSSENKTENPSKDALQKAEN